MIRDYSYSPSQGGAAITAICNKMRIALINAAKERLPLGDYTPEDPQAVKERMAIFEQRVIVFSLIRAMGYHEMRAECIKQGIKKV